MSVYFSSKINAGKILTFSDENWLFITISLFFPKVKLSIFLKFFKSENGNLKNLKLTCMLDV